MSRTLHDEFARDWMKEFLSDFGAVEKERLEAGLKEAETNEDFSSLIESFYLCRSSANAEILFESLENDAATTVYASVEF
jgi:hypothetical protein